MMIGPYDREAALTALTRALPYVRLYRGKTFVVKCGGEVAGDPELLRSIAEQLLLLSEFGIRLVVVHGAGPQTTALAERLGHSSIFIDGRRVTTPDLLASAVMAQNGTVNTALLGACRRAGLPALGLSGIDSGLVRAQKRPPVPRTIEGREQLVDFGEVGEIESIAAGVIERLLAAGFVPVISSLAADDSGRVLNINADTVAARFAADLGALKLIFLTAIPGLLADREDPSSLISFVDLAGLDALERSGAPAGGMRPKIEATRLALERGVPRVHIVGLRLQLGLLAEIFTNEGAGTLIVKEAGELLPAEQPPAASRTETSR